MWNLKQLDLKQVKILKHDIEKFNQNQNSQNINVCKWHCNCQRTKFFPVSGENYQNIMTLAPNTIKYF